MTPNEAVSLRFVEGKSDKAYSVAIMPTDGGYNVVASWGRTGSTMQTAVKNASPVPLTAAQKKAESLLAAKMKKGYVPQGASAAAVGAQDSGKDTGYRPQLLEPASPEQVEAMLDDPAWWLQEKWDGERRLLLIEANGTVIGTNRRGQQVAVNGDLVSVIKSRIKVSGLTVMDGEDFGSKFAPFDLLVLNGQDIREQPYSDRLAQLEALIAAAVEMPQPVTWRTGVQKRQHYARLRDDGFEGVVFKRKDAPYLEGKQGRASVQYKDKFYESATCRALGRNGDKRSIGLELIDSVSGQWVFVGNCTVPANFPIPECGDLCEIAYLYAMPNGGSLIQPTYSGTRSDIRPEECTTAQLKYKSEQLHS